ncbi:MAG: NUDIX hydrolase [Alphaproteobacteria bacterium]|nr:NUDIX hydrolase [Alphaproteobacteria bacterium]
MTDPSTQPSVPAATILLLRDAGPMERRHLEVVMVERHRDIGFAGGALVFPGGRIDPTDRSPEWRSMASGLDSDALIAAGQIAAIREAFEEVGVILARRRGAEEFLDAEAATALADWRARSERDDAAFLEMATVEGLVLACDALSLFAHWVPPAGLHKRFDTLFFIAAAPVGQTICQDGFEATEAIWIRPAKAIEDGAAGRRKVIFPTARNLELLGLSAYTDEALIDARRRNIRRVQPRVLERDGVSYLTIPDDLGYPVTEEPLETAMRG